MKKTKNKNRDAQKKRTSHKAVASVLRPEGPQVEKMVKKVYIIQLSAVGRSIYFLFFACYERIPAKIPGYRGTARLRRRSDCECVWKRKQEGRLNSKRMLNQKAQQR